MVAVLPPNDGPQVLVDAFRDAKLIGKDETTLRLVDSAASFLRLSGGSWRTSSSRDRSSWETRIARLAAERDRELEVVAARHRDPQPHRFLVVVVFVVPKREPTR